MATISALEKNKTLKIAGKTYKKERQFL